MNLIDRFDQGLSPQKLSELDKEFTHTIQNEIDHLLYAVTDMSMSI